MLGSVYQSITIRIFKVQQFKSGTLSANVRVVVFTVELVTPT